MEAVVQQAGNVNYEVLKADTYAKGVARLQKLGEERPKTFKENIVARVVAYENGDNELFDTMLDSCTGVVNKKKSTKFKVVPQSRDLIDVHVTFNKSFLPIDYDTVHRIELDSSDGKYNQNLTRDEILDHPGWLVAVEADAHLLKTYRDIIFNGLKKEKAMGFYVRQNTEQDELRALFVYDLFNDSYAGGSYDLDNVGSFLRGSPVVGARSARVEKSGSENKDPESSLVLEVRGILSRFDKYVGYVNETEHLRERYQAEEQLLALLKR